MMEFESTPICIAVIPSRSGSQRVKQKNVRLLAGKPIIAYTIQAALSSGLFSRVIVSTDSCEIAKIAQQWGAEIPFLRSQDLAGDYTPVSLVTVDVLEKEDPSGDKYSYVAQLMANCPFRTSDDILDSYDQFINLNADAQISVMSYRLQNPWWAMSLTLSSQLNFLFPDEIKKRSQDLPKLYCPTGAVWWAKTDILRQNKTFYIPGCKGWKISWQNGIDIDTEEDWSLAEFIFWFKQSGKF